MSRIEIHEHIDVSQWLPRNWEELYIHKPNKLPIDQLMERGTISGDQHSAAFFIIKLRRNINNALGVDKIIEEYSGDVSESYHVLSPSCTLNYVLNGLRPYQLNILNAVTITHRSDFDREERPATQNDLRWISYCCKTLQESLDHVKKNIDELVKLAKNASQDGGVAMSKFHPLPQ